MKKYLYILVVFLISLLLIGCSRRVYVVTFNTNSPIVVEDQEVRNNQFAIEPDAPTRDGYIFIYWTKDGEEFKFTEEPITSDITLVALWEQITEQTKAFSVTFNSDGGSNVSEQSVF